VTYIFALWFRVRFASFARTTSNAAWARPTEKSRCPDGSCCVELGIVNHSIEWDRLRANRPAVKAPHNRNRHEPTTDRRRSLKQARSVGVESIDRMYLNVYVPQLQAVEGSLKFIRIDRGHSSLNFP
jgi:hypothetical protein